MVLIIGSCQYPCSTQPLPRASSHAAHHPYPACASSDRTRHLRHTPAARVGRSLTVVWKHRHVQEANAARDAAPVRLHLPATSNQRVSSAPLYFNCLRPVWHPAPLTFPPPFPAARRCTDRAIAAALAGRRDRVLVQGEALLIDGVGQLAPLVLHPKDEVGL